MSLLTNRNKKTDPPNETNKKGYGYLKKLQTEAESKNVDYKYSDQQKNDIERQIKAKEEKGYKVTRSYDSKGNTIGWGWEKEKKIIPTPTGRASKPVMEADQTNKTGQKQVGTRYWDDKNKQWKISK